MLRSEKSFFVAGTLETVFNEYLPRLIDYLQKCLLLSGHHSFLRVKEALFFVYFCHLIT